MGLGGTSRSEGRFTQQLALSHGAEPRIIWIRGVKAQFGTLAIPSALGVDPALTRILIALPHGAEAGSLTFVTCQSRPLRESSMTTADDGTVTTNMLEDSKEPWAFSS